MSMTPDENPLGDEARAGEPDAAPLEHIVDDLASKEECADWIFSELSKARTAESIAEELVENGWSEDDAGDLVERVRRLTRGERGVVTRDDVMRGLNRRYQRGMASGWLVGFPVLAAAFRLMHSLVNSIALVRVRRSGSRRQEHLVEREQDRLD
jgi:hypothetical protein